MSENEAPRQRLFTLEEANELVPELTRLIARVQGQYRALLTELSARGLTHDDLEEALQVPANQPLQVLLDDITACIAEIESHGCHFKGLDLGLVDFPCRIQNRVVYLCWQYGEDHVGYWHSIEDGFRGRQPISEEMGIRRTIN